MTNPLVAVKRILVGRPMSSGELGHTLLPKAIALPVFSSDALSSVAYATQEIMLVLAVAGTAAIQNVIPISFAVASLLAIVVISYRQTVRAYPSGGGAYIVARENLGEYPGLLAASALMVDYVLTVAVSVTAGVEAIVSAAPNLHQDSIAIAMIFIGFVALANLRGVRESGVLFAIPTYGFIISIFILIITGFVQCVGGCPQAASAGRELHGVGALGFLLILKAFSAGTTALTGVEAISNGVPAFRYPQSRNAATTLTIMGTISISMFLGISWLAAHTHVIYEHGDKQTVVAQVTAAIFGGGSAFFYVLQVMTAAILILAANTAFADFPRLASILAIDRYLPGRFKSRGNRLVFSNGIVLLALFAALLIWAFDANLNHLIQLYLIGVFVSFTLSQAGMVVHWRKLNEPGSLRAGIINGFGAVMTGVVLLVVIQSKFLTGAWIVVVAVPIVMFLMRSIHRHYMQVGRELAHPERQPGERRPSHQHMIILVARLDAATTRAIGYARSMRPADITAVTTDATAMAAWKRMAPDVPITTLQGAGSTTKKIKEHLRQRRTTLASDDFLTFIVPEVLRSRSLLEVFRRPGLQLLKGLLLGQEGVQVMNIPLVRDDIDTDADQAAEPARNFVCVLVSGVHNGTLQAIEYAETLQAADIRAVTFNVDAQESERIGNEWLAKRIPHPLEIEDSPFRGDIGVAVQNYVKQFNPDGLHRVVTVVIPEFVVKKKRHQILHNQTALIVKRRLLFERGVVVVSVPFRV